jgi:hypothetical protein
LVCENGVILSTFALLGSGFGLGAGRSVGPANVSTTMMTAEPMIARGAHYTALLDTIDHKGATRLHAREREQLLEAAAMHCCSASLTARRRSGRPRF